MENIHSDVKVYRVNSAPEIVNSKAKQISTTTMSFTS